MAEFDVDEVHHVERSDILRHLAGEDVGRHAPVRLDRGMEGRVGEGGERQGAAGRQRFGEGTPARLGAGYDCAARQQATELGRRISVGRLVGKGDEVDAGAPRQMLQDVEGPDLVPAIRRERHPVGQEQDVAHQPSPRDSHGPTRLATGNGSRFQVATIAAYLGLRGSTERAGPSLRRA